MIAYSYPCIRVGAYEKLKINAGRHPALAQLNKDKVGMARTVRKENSKPINVVVYGKKSSVFEQYQQELQGVGYDLKIAPKFTNTTQHVSSSDICIVAATELAFCQPFFQNTNLPFLVYDMDCGSNDTEIEDIYPDAVGYFVGEPSTKSICLNIQLGLQRHRERENYAKRMQDITDKIENNRLTGIATGLLMSKTGLAADQIFDEIKSISRKKQQRVADVATEIIRILSSDELKTPEMKIIRSKPIRNLSLWLEGNIFGKHQK